MQNLNPFTMRPQLLLFSSFLFISLSVSKIYGATNKIQNTLTFEENKGQFTYSDGEIAEDVLFKAESPGLDIYLTEKGLSYVFISSEEEQKEEYGNERRNILPAEEETKMFDWNITHLMLEGASIKKANIVTENDLTKHTGFKNYYLAHCPQGIHNVRSFGKITITDVYPGIDWVIYSNSDSQKAMKYDFIVHPGADPSSIQLIYEGGGEISLTDDGSLELETTFGKIVESKPFSYIASSKEEVASNYKIISQQNLSETKSAPHFKTTIRFAIGEYPSNQKIIIDPELEWATFFGGNGADGPSGIDRDEYDNFYIVGYTCDVGFPVVDQGNGSYYEGTYQGGGMDMILSKFSPSGALLWSTYFGGNGGEGGFGIAVNSNNHVIITGNTKSLDLPTLNPGGGQFFQGSLANGTRDAFFVQFDELGVLKWSTYYGGTGTLDVFGSIAVDAQDNIYAAGYTDSWDMPTMDPGGNAYFQGSIGGAAYRDMFVIKFNANCSLEWATYFGGFYNEFTYSLCVHPTEGLYVAGTTYSHDFPTLDQGNGAYFWNSLSSSGDLDAVLVKFSLEGELLWSTYYQGGTSQDHGMGVTVDGAGNAFVTGYTQSTDFITLDPGGGAYYQSNYGGGSDDLFLLKFSKTGALLWSTYFGGNGAEWIGADDILVDQCSNVYLSMSTQSTDLSTLVGCSGNYLDNSYNGGTWNGDIALMKFTNGGIPLWSSYFGGDGDEFRSSMELDCAGENLWVTGEWVASGSNTYANTATYPLTDPGGAYYQPAFNGSDEGYIARFSLSNCDSTYCIENPFHCYIELSSLATKDSACNCLSSSTANAVGGVPPYNYEWSNGATTSTIDSLCPGTYSVTVSDMNANTNVQSIVIASPPEPIVTVSPSQLICPGEYATVSASTSSGQTPYYYYWSTGANSASIFEMNEGKYLVTVTDANGCTDIDTTYVEKGDVPKGEIVIGSQYCEHLKLTFEGEEVLSYLWSTGETDPIITVTESGTYWVELFNGQCPNHDTIDVTTEYVEPEIFIPNVFTPNNDSYNDELKFQLPQTESYLLTIFNRWGVKVFETTDSTQNWDGNSQPEGIYKYVLTYTELCLDRETVTRSGYVTLLR